VPIKTTIGHANNGPVRRRKNDPSANAPKMRAPNSTAICLAEVTLEMNATNAAERAQPGEPLMAKDSAKDEDRTKAGVLKSVLHQSTRMDVETSAEAATMPNR
jgi:hypothetical protein